MAPRPRLILAGLGHAHLLVLEALARGRFPPVRPVLVAPDDEYFYSGMVSGTIAGQYAPASACVVPSRLARAAGADWVRAAVARVDAAQRRVLLHDGTTLEYDLLSLGIGSRLRLDGIRGAGKHGIPIRPFREGVRVAREAEAALSRTPAGSRMRVLIVGGGAGGWEVGVCLDAALARAHGRDRFRVTLLHGGEHVLEEHPEPVRARGERILAGRGIETVPRVRVREATGEEVAAEDGRRFAYDVLVWATGPRAPALFGDSGLPTDGRGYLCVRPTLRVPGDAAIFGAGDCAAIEGEPWVPRAGVYAVREGEVLARNLARAARGEPLERYRPQREWLSLMNTGDGRALMSYRGFAAHGRVLWWLKDRIDRRFVSRFRRLER